MAAPTEVRIKPRQHSAFCRPPSGRCLATDAGDADARVVLGAALLAQDDKVGAETAFRDIPWIKVPGRAGTAPRGAMFAWP